MKKIVLFVLLAGAAFAGYTIIKSKSGEKKSPFRFSYKVIPGDKKDALTIDTNDLVLVELVQYFNDSLGVNTYVSGQMEMMASAVPAEEFLPFSTVLPGLKVGDSIYATQLADSIYTFFRDRTKFQDTTGSFNEFEFKKPVPKFFLQGGNVIRTGIRIVDKFCVDSSKPNYAADLVRYQTVKKKIEDKRVNDQVEGLKKTKKEGADFLAKNKNEKGVITTASGLQYKIITKGEGTVAPTDTTTVAVEYVGTLLNGTEFDNSKRNGKPVEFRLDGVVKGWTEALKLMRKGSEFKVWLPAELGYCDQANAAIPAGSTLAFIIKLVDIK